MSDAPDKYCIDTSALLHAWRRAYPFKRFGPVWKKIDGLIDEERLFSSIEVLIELGKRDDDVYAWAKDREHIFIDIEGDELQLKMQELMAKYPRLVDTRKNRSAADPFVIGFAALHDPPLIVVTQEGATTNLNKPNIPDVCTAEGIECMTLLDMIDREDWVF